jgi:release factor glutamine methyltransferase
VAFDSLCLETAPGLVMTPRRTSERLVAAARARVSGAARVADVGTGSGALALSIAAGCPDAVVWATDVDPHAVALARENVRRLGLSGRVFVRRGDLLDPVPGPLDLIVANLPYLPAREAALHPDLGREPFAAVFAAGDGLGHYRRLLEAAEEKLTPGGALLLQLRGEVVAASREELAGLRAAFSADGGDEADADAAGAGAVALVA